MISYFKNQLKDLPPVYFALVMATGIISIACHTVGFELLSHILFYLNHLEYGLLLLMFISRIIIYPNQLADNFKDSSTGPGFLTFVAASCMLGVQYWILKNFFMPAVILWVTGIITWIIIVYGFLIIMITKAYKPSLENGLNGGWLLLVVSTQSLSILGTHLSAYLYIPAYITLFLTLSAYLLGLFFYVMLISLIFFRLTFDPMKPQEFTPPYWVLMGAVAITALSGATLIQALNKAALYTDLVPIIKGLSIMAWIIASWWIPLLIMLEIWRHIYKKVRFTYRPANWDTVFTLGMYTVCTFQVAKAVSVPFLQVVPQVFIYVALTAWLITFLSMMRAIIHIHSIKRQSF